MRFLSGASGGRRAHLLTFFSLSLLLLGLLSLPTSAMPNPSPSLNGYLYTVNTTADIWPDGCDPLPSGECTLREAILEANNDGDISNIAFDIPTSDSGYDASTGVWTVRLVVELPDLDEAGTTINGATQTDNQGDTNPYGPEIEISGERLDPLTTCLVISWHNNVIQSLVVNRCPANGIHIQGDDNTIIGNYIGTDPTGTLDQGMGLHGILLDMGAERNTIGGSTDEERNIISGNDYRAVGLFGANNSDNVIHSNYIGTDRTGSAPLGNGSGIKIYLGAHDNTIGPDNIIAYNDSHGVQVDGTGSTRNTITQNSIHSNGGDGIALTNGGNNEFAPPADLTADCISVSGMANPCETVEIFSDADGEGRFYEEGVFSWNTGFTFDPASGRLRGRMVTATRTHPDGSTSSFSPPINYGCPEIFLPLIMKNY